jgi:hypothetical protein
MDGKVIKKNGRFSAGTFFNIVGEEDVIVDVAEEVILGDRCTIAGGTYFGGRRVEIGHDFYGYHWEGRKLDIGRNRIDCEYATLKVGNRCTFHENRIDLTREVTIGDDVGLSPEVVIYTHGYWQSVLEGFPANYDQVRIGDRVIVGFRSTVLPGATIDGDTVIGAHSLVTGTLDGGIYGGVPAKLIKELYTPSPHKQEEMLEGILAEYVRTLLYRKVSEQRPEQSIYNMVKFDGCVFNTNDRTVIGKETDLTDDFRDFLFRYGIRIYTNRPFRTIKVQR